jgi:hypothetical protein
VNEKREEIPPMRTMPQRIMASPTFYAGIRSYHHSSKDFKAALLGSGYAKLHLPAPNDPVFGVRNLSDEREAAFR